MPSGKKKIKKIAETAFDAVKSIKTSGYKKCLDQGGHFVKGKCNLPGKAEDSQSRTGRRKYVEKPKRSTYVKGRK